MIQLAIKCLMFQLSTFVTEHYESSSDKYLPLLQSGGGDKHNPIVTSLQTKSAEYIKLIQQVSLLDECLDYECSAPNRMELWPYVVNFQQICRLELSPLTSTQMCTNFTHMVQMKLMCKMVLIVANIMVPNTTCENSLVPRFFEEKNGQKLAFFAVLLFFTITTTPCTSLIAFH